MKLAAHIEQSFPKLAQGGYKVTSEKTKDYNCIAWAAGVKSSWWDPAPGYTWPDGAPRDYTIFALVSAYECIGFETCANAKLEKGFQKIAVYGDEDGYTHAARQLPSGRWTSKLGRSEDIEHATPDSVSGASYGKVVTIMRRRAS